MYDLLYCGEYEKEIREIVLKVVEEKKNS